MPEEVTSCILANGHSRCSTSLTYTPIGAACCGMMLKVVRARKSEREMTETRRSIHPLHEDNRRQAKAPGGSFTPYLIHTTMPCGHPFIAFSTRITERGQKNSTQRMLCNVSHQPDWRSTACPHHIRSASRICMNEMTIMRSMRYSL